MRLAFYFHQAAAASSQALNSSWHRGWDPRGASWAAPSPSILRTWSPSTSKTRPRYRIRDFQPQASRADVLCQSNSANDLKLVENLILRTGLPLEVPFRASLPLSSLLGNLVLPLMLRGFIPSLPTSSGMPGAQLDAFGRTMGMNMLLWCLLRQHSHLAPSPANATRSF